MRTMAGVVMIGSAFIAAAAGASPQSAHVRDRDHCWSAPNNADATANPLAGRPDTALGGRKLFEQRCTTCHAADARGTDRGPDLLAPDVQAQSDGALFWKLSSGNTRTGMPSFSFLPPLQRWQLVLHLRALAKPDTSTRP
jgi:mono/diheme cytochrome c family protein